MLESILGFMFRFKELPASAWAAQILQAVNIEMDSIERHSIGRLSLERIRGIRRMIKA